jgi:hypothetical protein
VGSRSDWIAEFAAYTPGATHVHYGSILLQKSGARDRVVRPFIRSNGLTPPSIPSLQNQR